MKVRIRRQINDTRIGIADFSSLSGFKWDTISGGVQSVAPQPFIHAYVWCDEVEGELPHSGSHGPCPHSIKVVIVKKDNTPEVWEKILKKAGPRPDIERSKPYKPDNDAREIVKAITERKDHPAIEIRRGLYVIKPKKIPRIIDSTDNTALNRGKKLKFMVQKLMASHPEFEETPYGSYLAYKKVR
jgi:hypothetical protein